MITGEIASAEKVMARCETMASCTDEKGKITRCYLCEGMNQVHNHLSSWMDQASLNPRCDNVGNLIGRRSSGSDCRTLLIGSHIDSVPDGGRYDGILGVLIGLAVIEELQDSALPFHIDLIGFSEEEGIRFKMPYLGSSAIAGNFQPEWLERCDSNGLSMRDAIRNFCLDPDAISESAYPSEQVIGYIEPHLEQGPVLERSQSPVGIVSGIAGQSRLRLAFHGQAGHAGTTPMLGRHDALAMASAFVHRVHDVGCTTEGLRATVGSIQTYPNAPNVIASRVEVSLDVRHVDDPVREKAIETLKQLAEEYAKQHGGQFELLEESTQRAVGVDSELNSELSAAVQDIGIEPIHLMSGAGHDAVAMAKRFPISMLFLRHPGGVSHHPDERVEVEDVAVAIEVLKRFILRLAAKYCH